MTRPKTETEWGLIIWHLRLSFGGGTFHLSQAMVHAPWFWQRWIMFCRGYRPHVQTRGYWWVKSGKVKWQTLELMCAHDVAYVRPQKYVRQYLKARIPHGTNRNY